MREIIYNVIEDFCTKAISDVLIGYHFEKFRDKEVLKHHLERLTAFGGNSINWYNRYYSRKTFSFALYSFAIKYSCRRIRSLDKTMNELWKKRIAIFEERFKAHPQMFK